MCQEKIEEKEKERVKIQLIEKEEIIQEKEKEQVPEQAQSQQIQPLQQQQLPPQKPVQQNMETITPEYISQLGQSKFFWDLCQLTLPDLVKMDLLLKSRDFFGLKKWKDVFKFEPNEIFKLKAHDRHK